MGRPQVDRFARFFVIPQTGHGLSGTNYAHDGDGQDDSRSRRFRTRCDRLALLFDWVERGVAPGDVGHRDRGREEPAAVFVSHVSEVRERTREASASSYRCATP